MVVIKLVVGSYRNDLFSTTTTFLSFIIENLRPLITFSRFFIKFFQYIFGTTHYVAVADLLCVLADLALTWLPPVPVCFLRYLSGGAR